MPRLRVRLDFLNTANLNVIDKISINICELLFWEKGDRFVKQICLNKLKVKVTGLIGIEKISEGRSRFATFEISFEGDKRSEHDEEVEEEYDDELNIIN